MSNAPDKTKIISALKTEWEDIAELCASFSDADWEMPTDCPGWSVKDNLSHILGTEKMLAGDPFPDIDIPDSPHLKNEIAKFNERWIAERRSKTGQEVLDEFKEVTQNRLKSLEAMTDAEWEAETQTPVGPAPYGRFMQIRILDNWMHEQDMRYGTQKMGNEDDSAAVEITLDEISLALGFVVGKKGGAPDNAKVEFEIKGNKGRTIRIQMMDGRGKNVESFSDTDTSSANGKENSSAEPNIKFSTSIGVFCRLIGGRKSGDESLRANEIDVESDGRFGQTAKNILDNLGYMI